MKQSPVYRPIYRLRVFTACLLSLLMVMAPMAPLAAPLAAAESAGQGTGHKDRVQPGSVARAPEAPPAAGISATLTDSFIDTSPADGRADAGSVVTYTATITNSSGSDATGVNFTDTISPYTTLIGGSIKISPRASADSYNATQDTPLDTTASVLPGVLANDTGTPAPTVGGVVGCADVTAPFSCSTAQPSGTVTLNTDGSFTYTPPSGFTGTDTFTYTATNGLAPDDTATVTITVTPPCPTITVTNPATTSGPAGTPFSQTFSQTGGVGTTNFTLNSGTLPTGLTLHSGTGVLDGTPTQGGTFPITVKATDSNGCTGVGPTYNLTITCQTITVTNPGVNTGTVNAAFSQTFSQSGGIGTITWSETGALPTGITLSTSTGVLSGTPTQSGSFPITVTATDSNGCTGTGSTYTLTINCQTITVTKPVTTTGTVDTAFSQNFTQTGAQGTATFTTASSLPAGLTLATNGTLSGTPTVTGSFPIVVTVTDSNSCTGTSSTYTLVIGCQTITVTKPVTTTGTVNTPFSQNFTQTGAHGTATFTTASTLPAGLGLATDGTLSGTPTQTGSFPIVVTVTDSNNCTGTSSTYTLVIGCQSITVTNPANSTGTAGTAFSEQFTQSGGVGTITWSKSGTLPTGILLNSSTGVLSGTTSQVGSFPITVTATDQNNCPGNGALYTLTINCQSITVTNPGVNTVQAGTAFDQAFTQSGILGTATWSETGALPSGILLNGSTGHLAGTTNQVGSFPITVKVTDTNGCFGTSAYTLTVTCPTITVARTGGGSFPAGTFNTAYAGQSFTASGGTGSYTFAYNGGTPPPGITLASNGTLSGTPTATGTFTFTVTATDTGTTCTGSQSFTIAVNPGVTNDSYSNLVNNTEAVVTGGNTTSPTTPFVSLSGTLVANDLPSGGVTINTTGTFSTTQGGSVTIASDGTFKYTPPVTVSPLSSDTFTYTASSNTGAGSTGPSSTTATVTLNLSNRVWYVKNDGSNGNGQSQSPFNTLAGAQTASTASDIIFVYNGDGTTTGQSTGITLKSNQQLIGEGVALVVNSNTLVAAGTKPQITNTTAASDAVTLNDGNTVKGLTITGATRDGISSVVTHAGFTADTLTVQNNTNVGIDLISMTGTVTITNSTISSIGSQALTINNGTAAVTVNNTNTINGGTGTAVTVANRPLSANAIDIGATITGAQIQLSSNASGTISFTGSQTLTTNTVNGVTLTTNTGATINFSGTLNVTKTTGIPFQASGGGTLNVTGTANLTSNGAANGLSLNGMTIGVSGVAFSSVSTTGATTGINLVNLSNTVSVNGGTITNGTTGISLQGLSTALSLAGMTITGPTTGITNTTNFGAITIGASVNVSATTALNLTTGNLNGTFANLSSTGGTNGVLLTSIGGSGWAATTGTLAGSTGAAFKVDGGNANMTYGGNITSTGFLVDIGATAGRTGGTIAFSGTLGGAGALAGTGIRIQSSTGTNVFTFSGTQTLGTSGSRMGGTAAVNLNANATTTTFNFNGTLSVFTGAFTAFTATGPTGGTINFSGTDSIDSQGPALVLSGMNLGSGTLSNVTSSGGANGISLTNVTGGTLTISGGALSGNSGSTFLVSGGSASVTYNGTMSQSNAQRIVNISGITGGTITLGGALTGSSSCTGVTLAGSAGTITFSGGISLNGTADTFTASNGSGPGFTLNVTGTNDIGATTKPTGPALNITNTTIGASNVIFHSISANGGTNGILLSGTGSTGGLQINGGGNVSNGGDFSGGLIQNTTGRGIQLTTTAKVVLNNIKVDTTGGAGIGGSGVTDFTLTNSTVSNNGSNHTAIDSNIDFGTATGGAPTDNNVQGVITITNNKLLTAWEHGIDIQNYSGTISNATISNNVITSTNSAATSSGSGIRLLGFGSAGGTSNITKATISGNTISNFPSGAGITSQYGNGAGAGGTWGTPNSATNVITISGNTMAGFSSVVPMNTNAVLCTLTGNGNAAWKVDNNTASLVGGSYIGVTIRGVAPVATADITNNHLTGMVSSSAQTIAYAVDFLSLASDHPSLTGTISGNVITAQDGEGIQALATTGSSGILDVTISNNSIAAPNCSGCNRFGMTVNAGLSAVAGGTPTVCAKITGNTAAGSGVDGGFGFRERTGCTLNIGSFPSPGTDPSAFIAGLNTFSAPPAGGVTNITGSNAGTCTAPLLLAEGGVGASLVPFNAFGFDQFSTSDESVPFDLAVKSLSSPATVTTSLSQEQLNSIVSAAAERWTATGLTQQQAAILRGIKFEITDLSSSYLGEADGNRVLVDRDAEGKGWFVDQTPTSDQNFANAVSATRLYTDSSSASAGHVDLLTAIEHEMGHKLGLPDTYAERDRDNLMYGYLTVGERRLPASGQARTAQPVNQVAQHLKLRSISAATLPAAMVTRRSDTPITPLSGETVNVNIGTLPAGKSITITFQVTLNTAMPSGTTQVTTQGTVTYTLPAPGANLDGTKTDAAATGLGPDASVLTDDPGAVPDTGPSDPTVTPVDAPTATGSTVSGRILDSNGNPVEGAGIRMSGTQNRLTVTDAQGNYHFDNVETAGLYTVVATRANFSFSPASRSFSVLGQNTDAAFNASPTGSTLNPLDTTEYFVRQQYVDFLNREPDEAGLNFWYNNIESCGNDAQCRAGKRTDTSAAFFLSTEFQQTGYLVYKSYQAAFGDLPGMPVPVRLSEFKPDTQEIGQGVVVNAPGWDTTLASNKSAFMAEFVQRSRFTSAYAPSLTPSEFVNKLFANAGVTPSETDRTAAVGEFGSAGTSADVAARGRALQRVAENSMLTQQEFTQAFVLIQYFGYLRRDPNTGPDADFTGYNFWLQKLNTFNGNFGDAEMVKSFLVSGEYRGRFPR